MQNQKLVVVLGMHRSGTSAITRGLQTMGVNLGNRLTPPNDEINAKGFWEDIDLNLFNVEILQAIGSHWHYLSPIQPVDIDLLSKRGYLLRAVDLLREKVGDHKVFGFKDPRVAKLLPFWKEVFRHCKFDVQYVLAVRHPLSTVRSLMKRDGFYPEKCYLLWLGHVVMFLSETLGQSRVFVDYDHLIHHPDEELDRIAGHLGLSLNPEALKVYTTEFLDDKLRHTCYAPSDLLLDEACPELVHDIYARLLEQVSHSLPIGSPTLDSCVSTWLAKYGNLSSAFRLADKLGIDAEHFGRELSICKVKIENLNIEIDSINADFDKKIIAINVSFDEELKTKNAQIAGLDQTVTALHAQLTTLGQVLSDRDQKVHELSKALEEQGYRIAERERRIIELHDESIRRGAWAENLEHAFKELQVQIVAITSSFSWRLTSPLRQIAQWPMNFLARSKNR